jgi:Transposase DDE domain
MVAAVARAAEGSALAALVHLVDYIPVPAAPRRCGRPATYSDRLFLKALVIMIVRHLAQVHTLLAVLEEPTPEMRRLRALLTEGGRFPARRTWERRLRAVPDRLPAQIGCLGRSLVGALDPWRDCGRAVAIDSTVLAARGGVWHRKDRERGVVPHSSIDMEAHWTKSGWHGWVYGWKLHLVSTVAAVWVPLAAELTPANVADNEPAPAPLDEVPPQVRFVLGDLHYNVPNVRDACAQTGRALVTPRYGAYPHADPGVEVRRVFHHLRSVAIETFNEQLKGIFGCHGQVPTRGLAATRRFALGAVFVYQLALLHRYQSASDLRRGLKPFLCAA